MNLRVIYLHGFASSPQSKKAQYFAARFAEIGVAVDIPALDEGNFAGLTISGQLGVIERKAGGEPAMLIGSSLGGYLAALYAARHAAVDSVVLLAPGFGFPRRWPEYLGAEKMTQWERDGVLPVFHYGKNAEVALSFSLIEDGRRYEDYPNVTQPCLIFHGRHDDVVPAAYSETFATGRPNVELHVEESDHELLNVLDPMWQRVRDFYSTRNGNRLSNF